MRNDNELHAEALKGIGTYLLIVKIKRWIKCLQKTNTKRQK